MRKRMSLRRKTVRAKYEKQVTTKCENYERDKTQQRKVRKRTNVGGLTEGKVEAVEGSTEARRKDENGCTEMRNIEEVPAFIQDEKDGRNLKDNKLQN